MLPSTSNTGGDPNLSALPPPSSPPPHRRQSEPLTAHRDGGGGRFPSPFGSVEGIAASSSVHRLTVAERDGGQQVLVPILLQRGPSHPLDVSHRAAAPPPP
jgi:hypothetical protein